MVGLDPGRNREGTATGSWQEKSSKVCVCVCVRDCRIKWNIVFNDDRILGVTWKLALEVE